MISVSHPVMLHLYRRIERDNRSVQIVEPGAGLQGRTTAYRSNSASQHAAEKEGNDFHTFFLKALEQQE
ncbi:MAG: hypothetical protein HQM02_00280 [Magnetococcales bacterium]|nr:hypothetical protein [Magnetococcales bacterium]